MGEDPKRKRVGKRDLCEGGGCGASGAQVCGVNRLDRDTVACMHEAVAQMAHSPGNPPAASSECWPASWRDWLSSHCAVRFGRLNRFPAVSVARKGLVSLLARHSSTVQFDTPYGFQILLPAWHAGMVIAAMDGRISHPGITQAFCEVIRPGHTVIDGGAHVGFYTLLAAKLLKSQGLVVAFEPDPRNFALLQANVALNGLSRVSHLEQKALSNADGELDFWVSANDSMIGSLVELPGLQQSGTRVAATRLDDYLTSQNIGKVDVIKLDLEGAEALALQGMRHSLETAALLAYEINRPRLARLGIDPLELIDQTAAWGRFTLILMTDERSNEVLRIDDSRCAQVLKEDQMANVICAKEEAAERLSGKFSG